MSGAFKFEILPGLPATGPLPLIFPDLARSRHSEGFIVRFHSVGGHSWVGNFHRGLSRCDEVVEHPDDDHILVVAGGQGYVVDPIREQQISLIGGAVLGVLRIDVPRMLVLDHQGIAFEAIDRHGSRWHTRRLSWDGFQRIQVSEGKIRGEARDVTADRWVPFTVDLETGHSSGGTYRRPDGVSRERLFVAPGGAGS